MKIFNILGIEVATLENTKETPGKHTLKWTAKGNAPGIYFCTITSGNFVESKKIILNE